MIARTEKNGFATKITITTQFLDEVMIHHCPAFGSSLMLDPTVIISSIPPHASPDRLVELAAALKRAAKEMRKLIKE